MRHSKLLCLAVSILLIQATGARAQVSAPSLSPAPGYYPVSQSVTVTAAGADTIRYTTDGTDPTAASGITYTGPIAIQRSLLLKTRAWSGATWSPVTSGSYSIAGAIVAGQSHALAVRSDKQRLYSWGSNSNGQLGNQYQSLTSPATVPIEVLDINQAIFTGVIAADAGTFHTVTLRDDGTVWCFGDGSQGQLGYSGTNDKRWPVSVKKSGDGSVLTGCIQVAAGAKHSYAMMGENVWCWGNNNKRQLGNGTTTDLLSAGRVKLPGGTENLSGVTYIASGAHHGMAVSGGLVYVWGDNAYSQCTSAYGNPVAYAKTVSGLSGIAKVAAGDYHCFAISPSGSVWGWGLNSSGQLGLSHTSAVSTPVSVMSGVVTVEGGANHTLFLRNDGVVLACGANNAGQLGNGTVGGASSTPAIVKLSAGVNLTNVVAIAAGGDTSYALTWDGWLYVWGAGESGQMANGSMTATQPYAHQITQIIAGNLAPTVDLSVTPQSAAELASFALTATVWDFENALAKVDFYKDGGWLGSDTNPPYQYTLSNVPAGVYQFTALATDVPGASTLSAVKSGTSRYQTISLSSVIETLQEGQSTSGAFRFSRGASDPANIQLTINYTVSGNATSGSDFTALAGTATLLTGSSYVDVPLTTLDDLLVEGSETVTVTTASGAYQGGATPATVTIEDNPPMVTVTVIGSPVISEMTLPYPAFRFTLDRPLASPMEVHYSVGGSATANVDYLALSGTVFLPAGTNPTVDIELQPYIDLPYDPDETITVSVVATANNVGGDPASATVTVRDMPPSDSDGDFLPNEWEVLHGFDAENPDSNGNGVADGLEDADGDGLSNQQEYIIGTDPWDVGSTGTAPLIKMGGDEQLGVSDAFLPLPLVVKAQQSDGAAWVGATVTFAILQGGGQLSVTNDPSTAVLSNTLEVVTGADGLAQAYAKMPNDQGRDVKILASINGGPLVQFTATLNGLAGRWELNTDTSDSSGHGYDAQVSATGTSWGTGYGAGSLILTGTQHLVISNAENRLIPRNAKPFSLSFWFKQDAITLGQMTALITNETTNVSGFRMGIDDGLYQTNGNRLMVWTDESGGTIRLTSQSAVETGTWYHVVLTYDGATAKCYINDQLEAQAIGAVNSNINDILVGGGISGFPGLTGAIDDVQVYRGVIDEAVVHQLYYRDTDGDTLADVWEERLGLVIGDPDSDDNGVLDGNEDFDRDGITNANEILFGKDPTDHFEGVLPAITIDSGNNQSCKANTWLPSPLKVQLSYAGNELLKDNPVDFVIVSGSGRLGTTRAWTNASGVASVEFINPPGDSNWTVKAYVKSGYLENSVIFSGTSIKPAAAASNVQVIQNADGSWDMTWTDNADDEDEYEIRLWNPDTRMYDVVGTVPANTNAVHINADRTLAP